MLRFLRDKRRVSVDPLSLTIAPLLKIWKWDKSENKDKATELLTYIHLVSQIDQSAPYSKANPTEVESLVKKEVWGNYEYEFPHPWTAEMIEEIVFHYQSAFESADEASVRGFDKKIYEINKIVEETDVKIKESINRGAVTFVSNYPLISKMMQEMVKIAKTRDELKGMIIKQTSRDNLKGSKKLSFMDKRRRELKTVTEESKSTEEPIGL